MSGRILVSLDGGGSATIWPELTTSNIAAEQLAIAGMKVKGLLEESLRPKEPVDARQLTIEHVLPQTLTDAVRTEFGATLPAEAEVAFAHERLVHTLGNLTLTGYNSELSNRPFSQKRTMLAKSGVRMNQTIAEHPTWGASEITDRGQALAERIIDLWPGPNEKLVGVRDRESELRVDSRPDAPTMRTHAYSLLKAIFRTAVARKLVKESPVSVEGATSRAVPKEINLLTVAQVQELADAMRPQHRLMVLLAAWCSLRFGELTGLRHRDIHLSEDLTEGTITVEQAAVTVAGERLITTPKSLAGHRTIYLPPHLIEDVRQHLATYTRNDPDALVFPGTDGRPLTPGQVYGHAPRFDRRGRQKHPGNGFYKARYQIGRPDFRFHDLRHFAATMAAISGATTKELMQFAGHSDIHVAMRYQEAVNDRKKDLAKRMAMLAHPPDDA